MAAEGGVLLADACSVPDAELKAQEEGVRAALALILDGTVSWSCDGEVILSDAAIEPRARAGRLEIRQQHRALAGRLPCQDVATRAARKDTLC